MRGDAYGRGYDNPDSADRGNAEEYSGAMDRLADDRRRAEAAQQSARPAVAQPIEPYRTGVNGGTVILFFLAGPLVVALLPTLAFLAGSAFLASLVSGLFVVALMPVLLGRQVTYRDAWRLSFAGLARYLIATVVVSFLVIWLRSPAVPWPQMESALVQAWSLTISTTRFSMVTDVSTVAAAPIDTWPAVVGLGLLTRAPGFIWLTLALRSRLRRAYPVRSELIAAGVLALIAVEGALSVGWWAAGALSARWSRTPC
jgi:hypothetical protein